VVLAAATPMTVAGRNLQAEATEVLGRGFGVDWVTSARRTARCKQTSPP